MTTGANEEEVEGTAGDSDEVGPITPKARSSTSARSNTKVADSTSAKVEDPSVGEQTVTVALNGGVSAENVFFGFGAAPSRKDPPAPDTGLLSSTEVAAVTSLYYQSPSYQALSRALRSARIVIIHGPKGTGRRAAAITALHEVAPNQKVVVLSPVLTLHGLASRSWSEGTNYLILDHQADYRTQDQEVAWRAVAAALERIGSVLAITTDRPYAAVEHTFIHVQGWEAPETVPVLLSLLDWSADDVDDGWLAEIESGLPDSPTMTQLATLVNHLKGGQTVAEALQVFTDAARDRLDRWFGEEKPVSQLAEVAVAAFLGPQFERSFDRHVVDLEAALSRYATEDGQGSANTGTRERRIYRRQFSIDDLLVRRLETAHRSAEHVVVFREPEMRPVALGQLWQLQGVEFWDVLRIWLYDCLEDGASDEIAYALAVIARSSALEVEANYLLPWADGAHGLNAQVAAVLTLWHMTSDDLTAPVALQIVVDWINSSSIGRRQCAVVSLGGDLGVRFPGESIRRLWQGVSQSISVREEAIFSMSALFARLVELERDAIIVLKLVQLQLQQRQSGASRLRELREATLQLAYQVVSATLPTNKSASFKLLHDNPAASDQLATIYALLVRHRPLRRVALESLRRGLLDLADFGDQAIEEARSFGKVLARMMPLEEANGLRRDFTMIDDRARRGEEGNPAETILACFESFFVPGQ